MRVVVVDQPGLEGMRPDIPQTKMGLNATYDAKDAIAQRRKLQERNGWQFLSRPFNSVTVSFTSVSRVRYVLADKSTLAMSHHLPMQGFKAWADGVEVDLKYPLDFLAWHQYRETYRDSSLWCGNDGEAPMMVFSGTSHQGTGDVAGGTLPAGKATVELVASPAANTYPSGTYMATTHNKGTNWRNPQSFLRVLERNDKTIALEGVKNAIAGTAQKTAGNPFGMTYPNVAIYGAGTITIAGTTATVTGGKFKTGEWGHVIEKTDALLVRQANGSWAMCAINAVPTETTLTVDAPAVTDASYFIMRRSPFTDACVNKGSPFFAGVKQFPSRVYAGTPGGNLGLPPGWPPNVPFPLTDDPQFQSTDQAAFELYPIDVPDIYGEPIVALLPVGDAVLVCKRRSFHAVYGAYPDFTQRSVDEGAGCLHRGGAAATFSGVWIAGDEAMYTWRDGRMVDISFDKTATLWHSFTRYFTDQDWIAIGERDSHIFLTATSGNQQRKGTWIYDIRRDEWMCEVTNFHPLHYFSGEQGGDTVECLAVSPDHHGQVIDAGYMVEETKPRLPDGNGLGPSFAYESTFGLAQANGIEGETILGDIAIHARIDTPNPGQDELGVTVMSHGGVRREVGKAPTAKTLRPLRSTDPQLVDRHDRRVNSKGRIHKVRIERTSPFRPNGAYCELMQINLSVFDAGVDT